ncbi:MAG: 5-oxoprolinase subunit PxpB, partial [Segetibacter sp.]
IISFEEVSSIFLNKEVLSVSRLIQEAAIVGVRDIVPAYSSITVHYNVVAITKKSQFTSAFETVKEQIEIVLLKKGEGIEEVSRQLRIPVCYAAKFGWDLHSMATQLNLTIEEIVSLHAGRKYRVYMIGFLPGFPYMGEVDERIAFPRKQEPRLQIGEGYVGIAGRQTGIYPLPSPGGWQIIGRTPIKLFDKNKEDPALFKAGDEVEFFSITENEFNHY